MGRTVPAARKLLALARALGATHVKLISTKDVVVDERVRLKCQVPRCANYDRHLLCPPRAMDVDEFRKVLRAYRTAILVQIEPRPRSRGNGRGKLSEDRGIAATEMTDPEELAKRLHWLVESLEAAAFSEGFYLAAGLIADDCKLCERCADARKGELCRHPFRARPSMQAMGIDVVRTCKNAGLPISFSPRAKLRYTGLLLLE